MAIAGGEIDADFVAVIGLMGSACLLNNINDADDVELFLEISLKLLDNELYSKSS